MRRYLLQVGIPSIILVILIVTDQFIQQYHLFHFTKWGLFAFFVITSVVTSLITDYGAKGDPKSFQVYYFLSMGVRVFLSIIFVFICIILRIDQIYLFVINFFVFYFLYFVFEIYFLLGNLRAKSETSE